MDQMYFRAAFPAFPEFWDSRNREQVPVTAGSVGAGMRAGGPHTFSRQKRNIMSAPLLGLRPGCTCLEREWWLPTGRMISHSLNTELWRTYSLRDSIAALLKKRSVVPRLPPKLSIGASPGNWRPSMDAPLIPPQPQFPVLCAPSALDHTLSHQHPQLPCLWASRLRWTFPATRGPMFIQGKCLFTSCIVGLLSCSNM